MSYDFTGTLHRVDPTQQVSDKFAKREFVVAQDDGKYPNYVKFELTQDRCDLLDAYREGDVVTVSFDVRGRQWQDKFFTNLHAWRITSENTAGPVANLRDAAPDPAYAARTALSAPDNLPF